MFRMIGFLLLCFSYIMRVTSRYASKQPSALGDTAVNISVRSAEAHDALLIQSLVDHLTEELFGPFNILNVM